MSYHEKRSNLLYVLRNWTLWNVFNGVVIDIKLRICDTRETLRYLEP